MMTSDETRLILRAIEAANKTALELSAALAAGAIGEQEISRLALGVIMADAGKAAQACIGELSAWSVSHGL